jgi:hypothetical protein
MQIPTRENVTVLFLDLQEEIVKNSRTLPLERLRRGSGALAKLAALHKLPSFLSAVPPGGAFMEQVTTPLAGVASEIVVQRTALDALAAGYEVQVAVDACGGIDPRTEDAAWRRITAAGGTTTSVTTLAAELTGDFTTALGGATLGIVYETIGG